VSVLSVILFSSVFVIALIMENSLEIEGIEVSPYNKKYKNKYNIVFAIILFLIAALRHPNTGADTSGYYWMYNKMLSDFNSLDYYWIQFITAIKNGTYTDTLNWELLSKLLSYVIRDGQLWLALVSAVFIFTVYKTIKEYSEDPVISWVYILCIYIYTFILQGLRQSIAMAFILMSIKYVYKRNLLGFIIMVTLATLFHQSAKVFFIVYPLYNLKVSNIYFLIIAVSFFVARFFSSIVSVILNKLVTDSRFSDYLQGRENMYSATSFFVLGAIFIFCYVNKDKLLKKNPQNQILYTISMLSLVIQSTAGIVAEMFRVSYYFNMFNMLLVANVCSSIEDDKKRRQTKFIILLIFVLYFFVSGGYRYKFYWQ